MLENSVWAQYHGEGSIRGALAVLFDCDVSQILEDEGVLYAEIKRTLTKKELRLFVMHEAAQTPEAIMEALGYDRDALDAAVKKTYHKLRNKVRPRIKAVSKNNSET